MPPDGPNNPESARRGRPRKWGSEAERKRAYRTRKAKDLAEPDRLRDELRAARAEVRRLETEAARLGRAVEQARRKAAKSLIRQVELEDRIEQRDKSIAFWQHRAELAERQIHLAPRPDGPSDGT